MKALHVWVGRYHDVCRELRECEGQLERMTDAFCALLPLLDDEQLAEAERLLGGATLRNMYVNSQESM